MPRKMNYRKIWIRVAPSNDPALIGVEVVRLPWSKYRKLTSTPMEVELTPAVMRFMRMGNAVECPAPIVSFATLEEND